MQADAKPINALPEDPAILQALLLSAWSERDALAEQNERLQHLLLKLTRLKFGTKSERLPDDQLQLALGDVEPPSHNCRRKESSGTQSASRKPVPSGGPAAVPCRRIYLVSR